MPSISSLDAALSRRVSSSDFLAKLRTLGPASPVLTRFADESALVAFLARARRYGAPRDAVLCEMVRVTQTRPSRLTRDALVLALLPSVRRVLNRVRETSAESFDEDFAEAVACTLDAALSYDTETRSVHVQASVELDAFNVFFRRWQAENRTRDAIDALTSFLRVVNGGQEAAAVDTCLFPCVPEPHADALTKDDVRLGEVVLEDLTARGAIAGLDATILVELRLRDRTSTSLADRLAIDRRTVVRRADRAAAAIRDAFHARLAVTNARFPHGLTSRGRTGDEETFP